MSPRKTTVEQNKGVFEVEWPMFGELSRALALKVVRDYDPEIVIGVATAGVVPGAVIAAIMDREFHSIIVSRRYQSASVRDTPAVFGAVPPAVRDRRVLVVDETCDSGMTMRLAVGAIAGLLFYMGERKILDERLLYLVWQPAVAFCIGLALPRQSQDA